MNVINFKSNPDMYYKELINDKCNTVRKIDMNDERFEIIQRFPKENLRINIINSATGAKFNRYVSDVSWFGNFVIISWIAELLGEEK